MIFVLPKKKNIKQLQENNNQTRKSKLNKISSSNLFTQFIYSEEHAHTKLKNLNLIVCEKPNVFPYETQTINSINVSLA